MQELAWGCPTHSGGRTCCRASALRPLILTSVTCNTAMDARGREAERMEGREQRGTTPSTPRMAAHPMLGP